MHISGIFSLALAIVFLITMSCGCISQTPVQEQTVVPTPPVQAVESHKSGFTAYINGKYETALDFYNKSLESDPTYTRAWMDKGNVLTKLNRTPEAIAAYDAALALDTNIPQVWNSRGESLMTLGRYQEALESFNKALVINPDYAKAQENKNLTLSKLT